MCDLCRKMICPPNCPNCASTYAPKPPLQCVCCGEFLRTGDSFYRMHGFPYCEDCLDNADADFLVRICETSKRKWLEQMGFSHEYAVVK